MHSPLITLRTYNKIGMDIRLLTYIYRYHITSLKADQSSIDGI